MLNISKSKYTRTSEALAKSRGKQSSSGVCQKDNCNNFYHCSTGESSQDIWFAEASSPCAPRAICYLCPLGWLQQNTTDRLLQYCDLTDLFHTVWKGESPRTRCQDGQLGALLQTETTFYSFTRQKRLGSSLGLVL